MKIQKSLSVDFAAPADRAWAINGGQFTEIGDWSRHVMQSWSLEGAPVGDAGVAGRVCRVRGFGDVREKLLAYDDTKRGFTIRIDEGLPFFVHHSTFSSEIEPLGSNRCKYSLTYQMDLQPLFGLLLGPLLRRKIGSAIETIVADLKYYAETGEIHPDKLETKSAALVA